MTSVADLLAGKRLCICAGAGGVGKTTVSAAIAGGLAREGGTIAVVTIDPARRLATALGLEELGNELQRVEAGRLAVDGKEPAGELWAMQLDSKRTFDTLIERLAPDSGTAQEVLDNRIYQQLSSAVAGSQEFTAMAKLYELDRSGRFDMIVLDTPPSRNALDFLDAPDRLTGFFQGRAVRLFLRPAGIGGRLFGAGSSMVLGILKRVTGVDLLADLSVFFRSLSGLLDGFAERAAGVKALLADPGTTFLLVTAPEHEPVEEAIAFHRRAVAGGLSLGGLVVNRVRAAPPGGGHVTDELAQRLGAALTEKVAEAAHAADELAARDHRSIERLRRALGSPRTVVVPQLTEDIHDAAGLSAMEDALFGVAPQAA